MVTIITPTFNHEKFIAACIDSVLQQTEPRWEMIIIDDGSTDGTPEIVRRFHDPRITFVREDHRGITALGDRYNEALHRAKGELLLILEGDDYIPRDRLEIQLPSFEDPEVVLSHGRYAYAYEKERIVYGLSFKEEDLRNKPRGSALRIFLQGFNPIGTQSVMLRKSTLLEAGGFVQPGYLPLVDYPTWMQLALRGQFFFIPRVLGYWRRHALSVTMQSNEEIVLGFIRYCDEFVQVHGEYLNGLGLGPYSQNRGVLAYLSLAWSKLSKGDWKNAYDLAQESWKRREVIDGAFKRKILITFLSAYLHLDIPSAMKILRRRLGLRLQRDPSGVAFSS